MSFLRKLFGREEPEDVAVSLDVDRRKEQLQRLERALDALASEMRADHTMDDPAWRERVNEYQPAGWRGDDHATRYADPGGCAGSGVRDSSAVHRADS